MLPSLLRAAPELVKKSPPIAPVLTTLNSDRFLDALQVSEIALERSAVLWPEVTWNCFQVLMALRAKILLEKTPLLANFPQAITYPAFKSTHLQTVLQPALVNLIAAENQWEGGYSIAVFCPICPALAITLNQFGI